MQTRIGRRPLQEALAAYRAAWLAKMDEVNECIAANAPSEELVDKPELVKDAVRVAGPFHGGGGDRGGRRAGLSYRRCPRGVGRFRSR